MSENVLWFTEAGLDDIDKVGGKNASLGELIQNLSSAGVNVPEGFATTSAAFHTFLDESGVRDYIFKTLADLDADDVVALAAAGKDIRAKVRDTPFPSALEADIRSAFDTLTGSYDDPTAVSFAVRSSATAEDLPDASFAGQQETFLNVRGIDHILAAIKEVFASLYNDRAIAYRVHNDYSHEDVALSAGIQRMVRSDIGASGVMFTLDTESGFDDAVFITSAFGLGEGVVQGAVNPDEFYVYKPALRAGRPAILKRSVGGKALKMIYTDDQTVGRSTEFVDVAEPDRLRLSLTDDEVQELARHALAIEEHYGRPMDIEWGKDGVDGRIYVLQARPETVRSRDDSSALERFSIGEEGKGDVLIEGRAIGQRIGAGPVRVMHSLDQMVDFVEGEVLVADITDPDWEPIMKRASAIVTNRGGRTCHAAIIARELGIPAVVGTGDATHALADGRSVTVSCAEGETGFVYDGIADFELKRTELDHMPEIPVKVMMNVGTPDQAFSFAKLPNAGVGLARLEFIVNRQVGIHPRALLELDDQEPALKAEIEKRIAAYESPTDYFVKRVAEGVSMIAAAFAPKPVVVRMSDFKSNEYANLVGGARYEPHEENPMLGWRGASRYVSPDFRACFELECRAMKFVRDEIGLTNVKLMVPFVRTVEEARNVIELMEHNGLKRGENGLEIYMMCEIPSNALLADEFLEYFDGFSIGSNDMTQLSLGLDRDSSLVADEFDERNPAVKKLLAMAIEHCNAAGKYVGICGQGPSDHPDLAEWLLDQHIVSMSLNPDTVVDTWLRLAEHQK
ncbi:MULTISPECIES: phosphoenolpyruvate synthase [unclassified Pseudoclavibacter]|uniref:phosphoenolpyruvate synthase n=1 Tax=unclassified Pseudoclavibacter TaxID=2615177 RepID=UPI0013014B7B|nr:MULTISPECIES: phosphoenolpyruvate synthase [unclassified Pseudoclavibacter]KAB1646511.1 phosphoenolpyruvate synthase [Pseudoclavibacter sp. CFCC 14310]KAB1663331.1 phosphoenolpyruvate synthase [Pseudoclavibacter sp. CFCC 13611]